MNNIENLKDLIIYQSQNNENISVEVLYNEEDFWLTQKSMSKLFNVAENNITYHLQNIFKTKELEENRTTQKIRVVQKEGNRKVSREVTFYSLDAIIAVGYRVNSKEATDFIYDKWAIINFVKEFQNKKQYLNGNDYKKLEELYNRFLQVDIEKLPKAFVHGDIISTNVMKDKNNKLWIIDFAVSNYIPRIIDLAVSSCNLCLDAENKENTKKKVKMILEEYQKYNKLTDYELEQFPLFFDIANAMGILQISHLNTLGELSEEDKFWYDESEKGLEFSNEEFWKDIYVKK